MQRESFGIHAMFCRLVVLAVSSIPSITAAVRGRVTRVMEVAVGILVSFIAISFFILLGFSKPNGAEVMLGFLPSKLYFTDSGALLVATSIVGATVMPHNLYLHSSLVQTRAAVASSNEATDAARRRIMFFLSVDSTIALLCAFVVNASILIVAGAAFHAGNSDVSTLEDAYILLEPLLGQHAAPILFGAALLAAGQIATLTGTLAGQVVMEGFVQWRIKPFMRRLLTRLVAVVPALIATIVSGDSSLNTLLLVSQVVLSFQLPFAVFPLVLFTSDRAKMGNLTLSRFASVTGWIITFIIAAVSAMLIVTNFI
jgi:manganese transport protein